ncbi:hypothetical protein [Crassaminicella profunda]|uniref:hypothetical protein n=1 Tax=Crassaminicella profunda TaxID=1286698 RepID=UPI001CA6596D|nr:hypothetical protein [Crassaminicella profunda]QZY57176.1 hypothetical protein K7H06_09755 [Crassaminicella profunda]
MKIDMNIVYAIGLVIALFGFIKIVAPYLKRKDMDYYKEVKLALMLFGYSFRDDKLKKISDISLEVVRGLEELSIRSQEKHDEAVYLISKQLVDTFEIDVKAEALELIVQVAVAYLPKV